MSTEAPEALAAAREHLLDRARAHGAEAADAACTRRASLSVQVRMGRLEGMESEESHLAGLRVLIGRRQAGATTSDLRPAALDALAERVVAMARAAAEDPWCGLPVPGETAAGPPDDLQLADMSAPDPARLEADALACETAALSVAGITNSIGAGADWGESSVLYGASNGFRGGWRGTSWGVGMTAMAEDAAGKERDWDYHGARFARDLRRPEAVGRRAGERAAARLGARRIASQTAPVVFENRMAGRILAFFASAVSGAAVARGVSFLREDLGRRIFAAGVDIIDDPLLPGGWASHPFDGEGRPVSRRAIVEDGVLQTWLLNGAAARQLGLSATGHGTLNPGGAPGVGPSNLAFSPGTRDRDGLMADAGRGLLVTETLSPSFNPNTGDYSVGVAGFWFEDGRIAFPVNEVTVAANMRDMFATLAPGNDFEGLSALDSPSLLVPSMTIAGA